MELGVPLQPSSLNLDEKDVEWIKGMIAQGLLPPDWMDRCAHQRDKAIFGHDFKIDRDGRPIEQGLGSAANPTQQSIDAYIRWNGPSKDRPDGEPDFERKLAQMRKNLAEHEGKRDSKSDVADRERRKRMAGQ